MDIVTEDLDTLSRLYHDAEAELEKLRLERADLDLRRLQGEERMGQVALLADGLRSAARGSELVKKPEMRWSVIECDPGLIRGAGK